MESEFLLPKMDDLFSQAQQVGANAKQRSKLSEEYICMQKIYIVVKAERAHGERIACRSMIYFCPRNESINYLWPFGEFIRQDTTGNPVEAITSHNVQYPSSSSLFVAGLYSPLISLINRFFFSFFLRYTLATASFSLKFQGIIDPREQEHRIL